MIKWRTWATVNDPFPILLPHHCTPFAHLCDASPALTSSLNQLAFSRHYKSFPTSSLHRCKLSNQTRFDMKAIHAKQISTIFSRKKNKTIAVMLFWRQCFGSSCLYYQGQKSEVSLCCCHGTWRIKPASDFTYPGRQKQTEEKKKFMNECNLRFEKNVGLNERNILGAIFGVKSWALASWKLIFLWEKSMGMKS